MRSLRNLPLRLNLYGKSFKTDLDYTVYSIGKIPDRFKDEFSDDTHCWISWIGVPGIDYTWEVCIDNIKSGIWVLI